MSRITFASVVFTVAGIGLWGIVIAGLWVPVVPPQHDGALGNAAASAAVIAAVCWSVRWLRSSDPEKEALKREKVLLVRTLAGVVPMTETRLRRRIRPLPRVL